MQVGLNLSASKRGISLDRLGETNAKIPAGDGESGPGGDSALGLFGSLTASGQWRRPADPGRIEH